MKTPCFPQLYTSLSPTARKQREKNEKTPFPRPSRDVSGHDPRRTCRWRATPPPHLPAFPARGDTPARAMQGPHTAPAFPAREDMPSGGQRMHRAGAAPHGMTSSVPVRDKKVGIFRTPQALPCPPWERGRHGHGPRGDMFFSPARPGLHAPEHTVQPQRPAYRDKNALPRQRMLRKRGKDLRTGRRPPALRHGTGACAKRRARSPRAWENTVSSFPMQHRGYRSPGAWENTLPPAWGGTAPALPPAHGMVHERKNCARTCPGTVRRCARQLLQPSGRASPPSPHAADSPLSAMGTRAHGMAHAGTCSFPRHGPVCMRRSIPCSLNAPRTETKTPFPGRGCSENAGKTSAPDDAPLPCGTAQEPVQSAAPVLPVHGKTPCHPSRCNTGDTVPPEHGKTRFLRHGAAPPLHFPRRMGWCTREKTAPAPARAR